MKVIEFSGAQFDTIDNFGCLITRYIFDDEVHQGELVLCRFRDTRAEVLKVEKVECVNKALGLYELLLVKRKKHRGLNTIEIVLACIFVSCAFLLIGANVARSEAEQRVIREQRIHVEGEQIIVEYKGETYVHGCK